MYCRSENRVLDSVSNLVGDLIEHSVGGNGKKAFLKFILDFTAHVVFPEFELCFDDGFTVLIKWFKSSSLLFIVGLSEF